MPELTLVSFNTCGGRRVHRGPYDLERALGGLDADVLVLQEVWRGPDGSGSVDRVAAARGATVHTWSFGPAALDPWPQLKATGPGTMNLAVVTALPSRVAATLPLGATPLDPCPDRRALQVEVDVDGTPIDVVAVHTTSRLPHGPPMQLRRLAPQLPNGERFAVVAGDHNFWGPGIVRLMPGWRRTVLGKTWPAKRPRHQIDHVLVRPGSCEVLEAEVLGEVGSDHRPVRVRLRF